MSHETLAYLLEEDFEQAVETYSNDRFEQMILTRLDARRRLRIGVFGLAGFLGAGLAASQLKGLSEFSLFAELFTAMPQDAAMMAQSIAPSLIIACAAIVTALVIRREV